MSLAKVYTGVEESTNMFPTVIVAILICLWLYLLLADYGWERKKRRGLDLRVRTSTLRKQSERAEYEWYSWIRYLAVILIAYLNTIAVIDLKSQVYGGLVSPLRIVLAFSGVFLFSIALLAIDGYWDRRCRRGLSGSYVRIFWAYFWLRYPALILATITATKRSLQPLMK